ncbi:Molybdate-anion transporter-like protein [Cladobotryum mycophilum]|uniref:Molybdate-anion transporter n=1 Tax=Cladobotryum mycophilum TaxID=491253 RepID=A0ABR0SGU5_9HYPO
MEFYAANLAAFAILNTCLLFQHLRTRHSKSQIDAIPREGNSPLTVTARKFQYHFLLVYALAVAADWLQGPHTYAIYKYEKQISEKYVALLYAVGFISGGASAYFVGQLADRFGRKRMCLAYCICYGVTCLAMLSDNLPILCVGRVFGGYATTMLYSVFETWMISEYHALQLDETTLPLSNVFGNMTITSGIVAICSGVIGDSLVQYFGSRVWPFFASFACCTGAVVLMLLLWRENYGTQVSKLSSVGTFYHDTFTNPRIMTLGCAMLAFEGTMYLFVFFWSAALKSARTKSGSQEELPFGIVFSSFMCTMMMGSTILSVCNKSSSTGNAKTVLLMVFSLTVGSLATATLFDREHVMFYAFCVIEACVGAYFPSMAFIKSEVVGDSVRGGIYSLLRLPLNCFVVVVHAFDKEGDEHRNGVFLLCAFLLISTLWNVKNARFERVSA